MAKDENLVYLHRHLDGLYQVVTRLATLQQTTLEVLQQWRERITDASLGMPEVTNILDQLSRLQTDLEQQREEAQQALDKSKLTTPVHLHELSVERLNVIEPDGAIRLVLCNPQRSPGHVIDGDVFGEPEGKRWAGLYFFNEEGNECGGLIYSGKRREDGSYEAGGILTFDQYRQDQVICFQQGDGGGQHFAGLHIWDRPDIPIDEWARRFGHVWDLPSGPEKEAILKRLRAEGQLSAQRVFVGKNPNRAAVVSLQDVQGRVRLRLSVEATGEPKLEFLDEDGGVIAELPTHIRKVK